MALKKCFKCEQLKRLSEFYKHSQMADGYFGKCKDCAKNDAFIHRLNNLEKVRSYDRERGKLPHRVKANVDRNRDRRKRNPIQYLAQNMVRNAIRDGRLVKGTKCEDCGTTKKKLMGHHEDYYLPLEVVWLCQVCHIKRHTNEAR